jgi:cation-transporting ATPase 13A2
MIPARDEKNTPSFENTALFMFSIYLYMTYACIFSIGAPYRESAWKNRIFVIVCVMLLILNTIIVFADPSVVSELKLVVLPLGFKFVILGSAILAAVLSWVLESLLFPFLVRFASRRKKRTPSLLPVA